MAILESAVHAQTEAARAMHRPSVEDVLLSRVPRQSEAERQAEMERHAATQAQEEARAQRREEVLAALRDPRPTPDATSAALLKGLVS